MKCKTCCVVGIILGKLWNKFKGYSQVLSITITVLIIYVSVSFLLGALGYYLIDLFHIKWNRATDNIFWSNEIFGWVILEIIVIFILTGKALKEIYKYIKISISHLMIDIKNKCK